MEDIKRAFSHVFTRDVRAVDPTRKGLIVGDSLRVYDEPSGPQLSFLAGTDLPSRQKITNRLDEQGVAYTTGEDFTA